ncbi:Sec-independent protein translocase protein TatB [Melittangium boletus]|uniref:Sec-independent protein translocase protein TatB n=1 Tax=Melittangium boletus TaxID=83453 RepID=UPI003DA40675
MFNIGAGELIFILVAALLVLGPKQLPEFARAIGKFVREFRRQTDDVRTTVEREFYKMDQEFQDEPRPPVPMGFPSAPSQSLAALPPPQAVVDPGLGPAPAPVAESLAASAVPAPNPPDDPSQSG